jgi:hydroxyethylthiazole kinase
MQTPGALLKRLRDRGPLVQCITNYVAMDLSANALLALGASPAMVHAEDEAADFAHLAQGLLVNIGTLSAPWERAMELAANVGRRRGIPVVLDPVGAGATAFRDRAAARLLPLVSIVRGNASEVLSLAGAEARGKGVDAGDDASSARGQAETMAREHRRVVAVTGETDLATDGRRTVQLRGGSPLMPRVTALGCALSAAVAAAAAVADDPLDGVVAALAWWKQAGTVAAEAAAGPASFRTGFLDALYALTEAEVDAVAREDL